MKLEQWWLDPKFWRDGDVESCDSQPLLEAIISEARKRERAGVLEEIQKEADDLEKVGLKHTARAFRAFTTEIKKMKTL